MQKLRNPWSQTPELTRTNGLTMLTLSSTDVENCNDVERPAQRQWPCDPVDLSVDQVDLRSFGMTQDHLEWTAIIKIWIRYGHQTKFLLERSWGVTKIQLRQASSKKNVFSQEIAFFRILTGVKSENQHRIWTKCVHMGLIYHLKLSLIHISEPTRPY